jgi:isopenicillin-N epimerase
MFVNFDICPPLRAPQSCFRYLFLMPDHSTRLSAPTRPPQFGRHALDLWHLDPDIAFLNFGSFGAVPRCVLDLQKSWSERIERRPIEMLDRRLNELLLPAHDAATRFVNGVDGHNAFMVNATAAINAVIRSMCFAPGDRLVATTHVYNAVRKTMEWVARRDGAEYVEFDVPLPAGGPEEFADSFVERLPARTRLLMLDHVSSPTGLIFPVERILEAVSPLGIDTIIDGAHAPGMLDINVSRLLDLGAIAWIGNMHKWAFAPKGCAMLQVHPSLRDRVQPNVISHNADESFYERFLWQGTADFTSWLCLPESLAFGEEVFGWNALREANHGLAVWAHDLLCSAWGVEPISPLDGSMIGSIASVPVPESVRGRFKDPESLMASLYDRYRIEVPVMLWNERWHLRVSAQAFNEPSEYEALADAVLELGA